MPDPDRQILILYGSETGTAEDVAFSIGRHLRRWHWRIRVRSMDTCSLEDLLDESMVVTVCATTGNGVEPRSMSSFWKSLIRADLSHNLLDHLDIASFSLGDSSYERFCWAGKKLHRRLTALGAHDIIERADADEQNYLGIDGTLNEWLESLTNALEELFPSSQEPTPESLQPTPRIGLTPSNSPCPSSRSYPSNPLYQAKFSKFDRITRSDWYQDVRHIEFDLLDPLIYDPGDIAVLYPSNQPGEVDALVKGQGWEAVIDETYDLVPQDDNTFPPGIPQTASLRQLLTHYLDIRAVPRRSFFEFLRYFASDDRECEKLEEFCKPDGQDELYSYCQRPRRTALEVLPDFRSVRIPLNYLFDVFGVIRPRKFSIASYLGTHPGKIQLCVAIVRYKSLMIRAPRMGMCSNWLLNLPLGTELQIGLEKGVLGSHWRTVSGGDSSTSKPVILVGPGTGIAPLRAILEYRVVFGIKDNLMFFGCRSKDADYHYRDELEAMASSGDLQLRVAASRDQDHKIYVQDDIRRNKELICDFLFSRGGSLLISGSSGKMPSGVRRAVEDVLSETNHWSAADASHFVSELEVAGRWMEETW